MTDIVEQELYEAERIYLSFFDSEEKYQERIKKLILKEEKRLIVDLNDLRNAKIERVEKLLKNSFVEISAFQQALKKCINNINPDYGKLHEEFFIGFEGSFGSRQLNPRTLTSEFLGNMVCIEGIVTKASIVRSKVVHSVHYCPATLKSLERHYTDVTSLNPFPSSGAYPTKDEEGNILETEFGLSNYKDHQTLTVQEMPENAPAGQLPRSVEIILDNDLVDSCKAGDRVYVSGQFRCVPGKKGGFTTASFRVVLIANNVYLMTNKSCAKFEDADIETIRKMAKKKNIIDLLTKSIAPSICGHEYIKKAVLCQLLGGVERVLVNGSRIRGDINILLLGDPSVAKSQILRFVLQCARERSIATTGRGSTGVGLTAAVVTDSETGERGLEAGAMVLADRGIVCIDEFDKMSDIDRTAIHEVMEQGRVTIAKAGIHAKLNARCSVLAAANPVYGRYDQYKTPMENIGLQDSLLSRFDLLFIILDQCEDEADRKISDFVCSMHKYRMPGQDLGQALSLQTATKIDFVGNTDLSQQEKDLAAKKAGQIFEDADLLVPGSNRSRKRDYFTKEFLEKYIHVARALNPKLSKAASDILHEKYCDLRNQETEMSRNGSSVNKYRTQPITARTMETLIRLSTAFAKANLRKEVKAEDAINAAELISFVMFKEVLRKSQKRAKPTGESDDDSDALSEINDLTIGERPNKKMRTDDGDADTESAVVADPEMAVPEISDGEMVDLTRILSHVFQEKNATEMKIDELAVAVQQQRSSFTADQVKLCLNKLHDENKLMVSGDTVYMF